MAPRYRSNRATVTESLSPAAESYPDARAGQIPTSGQPTQPPGETARNKIKDRENAMSNTDSRIPSAAEQAVMAHLDRVRKEAAVAQARRRETEANAGADKAARNG
jgi:hypothetical protein